MLASIMDIIEFMKLDRRKRLSVVPTTGNEYENHLKAKVRVMAMMIQLGFINLEFEKRLPIYADGRLAPVDVYGEFPKTNSKLAVNVDGKVGHNSLRSFKKAEHRKQYLKQYHGITLRHIPVGNFDNNMDDDTIKEELLEAVLR